MAETTQIAAVAQQPIVAVKQQEIVLDAKSKKKVSAKKSAKKAEKAITAKSKRKTAIARASLKKGSGRIRVNGFDISTIEPIGFRNVMIESIGVSEATAELAKRVDIKVNVIGGGQSAQAQAVRGAIAKGISAFADTDIIRKEYMRYDRSLLVDDPRRVEPKKCRGPKARARFQKSYR
jgi:small subunit ribosomal protein S9